MKMWKDATFFDRKKVIFIMSSCVKISFKLVKIIYMVLIIIIYHVTEGATEDSVCDS